MIPNTQTPARNAIEYISTNVKAAMKVAGSKRNSLDVKRLTDSAINKSSGIARSTLRRLKTTGPDQGRLPRLETLNDLAASLGIPVAFLLMRPQDWMLLRNALNVLPNYQRGAEQIVGTKTQGDPEMAARLLESLQVFQSPMNIDTPAPAHMFSVLNALDDRIWRSSLVMAALTQPGAESPEDLAHATALAAALGNLIARLPDANAASA